MNIKSNPRISFRLLAMSPLGLLMILGQFVAAAQSDESDGHIPKYPKCVPATPGCTAGNTSATGGCRPQGLYCIPGPTLCANSEMVHGYTDAYCDTNEKVKTQCTVVDEDWEIGFCEKACTSFGTPLIGMCRCEYTGAADGSYWKVVKVKICSP